MKVEELYLQEKQNQVGVTLQRVLFETEIDIFPCLNPLEEAGWSGDDTVMSDLMSAQTEEKICQVIKHQTGEGDDEFLTIPLKRIDSSPHQHNLQVWIMLRPYGGWVDECLKQKSGNQTSNLNYSRFDENVVFAPTAVLPVHSLAPLEHLKPRLSREFHSRATSSGLFRWKG
ncbi:hypothetical protein J6590_046761 [Homalodisca vitripennis]|nr:hypothetical protein J6590_046761 [Homalodisca vitripennis]